MKKRQVLFASILACTNFLWAVLPAKSEVKARVLISCPTRQGMSNWTPKVVQFASGWELSRASGNYNIEPTLLYALLWYGQGQVAIVQVSESVLVGMAFTPSNFNSARSVMPKLTGYDQDGGYWEICISRNPIFCQSY